MSEAVTDGATANPAASASRSQRARIAAWVAGIVTCVLLAALSPALFDAWPVARALRIARVSGTVACCALLAALCVTPISRLLPSSSRLRASAPLVRRALGMTSAWLALLHAGAAFWGPLQASPAALLQTSHAYAGLTALAILVLLLLTSFTSVVRLLRVRTWQELHRLSYVAALLVVQHVALSAFADPRLVLGLLLTVLALLGARVAWAIAAGLRRG